MAFEIVKSSSGVPEAANRCEVLIDSASDLSSLPKELAAGSVAYTASMSAMYMKAIDGTWTQIGA